ncbi:MAG: hypothetical protein K9G24_01945 [Candidatus Nanopelagicales bacterium]|nr:hypothetical protein [Candidatus Nanopelagicales bacterium]MCF8541824.1 hypothetical protein [Candidatus Nanopelagicales bacterium]
MLPSRARLWPMAAAVALIAGCSTATAQAPPDAASSTSATPPAGMTASTSPSTAPESTLESTLESVQPSTTVLVSPSDSAPVTLDGTPLPTSPASGPAPVGAFVLSDSIGLSIAPTLSRLGYPVTGRVGQTASTDFLRTHLTSDIAQQAPAWVIVLGTNNRGDETDVMRVEEWLTTIRQLRSGKPRQHVYWVLPHRPDTYTGGMSTHTLDEVNAELVAAAAEFRWLHVLDFASQAAVNPQWFEQDGGRLHPDLDGQQVLIDLIAGVDAPPASSPARVTVIPIPTPKPSTSVSSEDGEEFAVETDQFAVESGEVADPSAPADTASAGDETAQPPADASGTEFSNG